MLGRMFFNGNDGYQNTLVYPPNTRAINSDKDNKILEWKSEGVYQKSKLYIVSKELAPKVELEFRKIFASFDKTFFMAVLE